VSVTATTIDWLRFRVQADPGEALEALKPLYGDLGPSITLGQPCRGVLGFQRGISVQLANVRLGRMDWGGDSQRGWLRVDIPGQGCGFVKDWDALEDIEALPAAELRRVDVALTTWRGEVTHDQVVQAHTDGQFTTRGRPPNLQQITHSDPNAGRTCYVGARTGDKFFRAYEKGKEIAGKLGTSHLGSTITHIDGFRVEDIYRCELELKADGTDIPWETVERRDQYFSGAYPFCAKVLPGIEPDILQRRPEKGPQRELHAALANLRHQFGNTLFTALTAYHGDIGAVWEKVCGTEHNKHLLEAGVLLFDHD
jgi:DNA relaxase NicK